MKIYAIQRLQIVFFLLFATTTITAQQGAINSNSIGNQFDYILNKSENYRDLKIVKTTLIQNLKQSVTSSYSIIEKQLSNSNAVVNNQKTEIGKLENQLRESNASLSKYTNLGPTVTFLGIQFDQVVFGSLFSILFFGSLITAAIFAIRFNKSNELTQNAQSVLVDLEEEYQEYKRRTIEREQKICRQLQDEINKVKQFTQMKAS